MRRAFEAGWGGVVWKTLGEEPAAVNVSSRYSAHYGKNREVIGFGGTAGYDATLNGKVLDLAIREAVNNLVNGIQSGAWNPASKVVTGSASRSAGQSNDASPTRANSACCSARGNIVNGRNPSDGWGATEVRHVHTRCSSVAMARIPP